MNGKICIYANKAPSSIMTVEKLIGKLDNVGFSVSRRFCPDADLMVVVGGDGTFIEAIHKFRFPQMPIIGINTGHLGFFQEIMPERMDDFIFNYTSGKYSVQTLSTVEILVRSKGEEHRHTGLNEVVITGSSSYAVHLNISIGDQFIERFSGDGLLISTPAGSTAYNYSLGGSIVDPRLNVLQVTPIAPMNTTAYRSFTSSLLLPSDLSLGAVVDPSPMPSGIRIVYDGYINEYDKIDDMTVSFSDIKVNLLRFESYDFWKKVKSKFL